MGRRNPDRIILAEDGSADIGRTRTGAAYRGRPARIPPVRHFGRTGEKSGRRAAVATVAAVYLSRRSSAKADDRRNAQRRTPNGRVNRPDPGLPRSRARRVVRLVRLVAQALRIVARPD